MQLLNSVCVSVRLWQAAADDFFFVWLDLFLSALLVSFEMSWYLVFFLDIVYTEFLFFLYRLTHVLGTARGFPPGRLTQTIAW